MIISKIFKKWILSMIFKIFKVSRHQVDQKWGFCSKASPLQMIITLRVLHGFFQDWKPEKLWPWRCDPADRNFCHLWITEISEPSEFKNFFFLKSRFFKSKKGRFLGFWRSGDAKQFVTPRGGPVRLFGLPWGISPSQGGSRQKEISDPPHPLRWKNRSSKSWKIDFSEIFF